MATATELAPAAAAAPPAPTPVQSAHRGEAVAITSRTAVEGRLRRATAAFVTAFFFAAIFGCAAIDLFWPVPAPKLVGIEKKQQDEKRAKARFSDGTLAKLIEDDLKLTSRVRRSANAVYSPMLFRVFREAGAGLITGPNYFLFRRERARVASPREEIIGVSTGRLRALARVLDHLGTRLVAVPLPRKEVVMQRELPSGVEVHPEYEEMFAASLREAGVDFVDLLPAFLAADGEPIYPAADSHWSAAGALIAARAIASAVLPPGERVHEPTLTSSLVDTSQMFAHALGLDAMAEPLMPHVPMRQSYFADRKVVMTSSKPAPGENPILLTGTSFSKHTTDESTYFGELLSVVLGKPIWNGARAGVSAIESLGSSLRSIAGRPLPKVIILEQPNHFALCADYPLHDVADVLASLPVPAGLQPLQHGHAELFGVAPFDENDSLKAGSITMGTTPRLAHLPWHSFVFPRDGTVGMLIRADVHSGQLMVSVDYLRSKMFVHWPKDRDRAFFPLAGDHLGQIFECFMWAEQGEVSLDLHSFEIVCDLDLTHSRRGASGKRTANGAGEWSETIAFTGEPLTDACVGIEISGPAGEPQLREVEATFADGAKKTLYGPKELLPAARLLLPLGPQTRALSRVDVRGHGQQPTAPIRGFWLPRIGR